MQIREIDVHDDALFRRWHAIYRTADTYQRPDARTWSEREAMVAFGAPDDSEEAHAFAAFDDAGAMVGAGYAFLPLLDNTDLAWGQVFVEPERRGRGIGGALVQELEDLTRRAGRTRVLSEAIFGFEHREDHPYRRFAEQHGYTLGSVEVLRRLNLPIDPAKLQQLADEAAERHADYRIEAFTGRVPDDVAQGYCDVVNRLAVDAPTGTIEFEAEAMTVANLRQREDQREQQGRTMLTTVARDATGTVVAVSDLVTVEDYPTRADQWTTLVLAEHRGHRLGLATKVRNLMELQRSHPQVTQVLTSNEEANDQMVAINELLGFKPIELLVEFEKKLR